MLSERVRSLALAQRVQVQALHLEQASASPS